MELTAALLDLCSSTKRPIIAIDGPAGAGKTTLAEHLTASLSLKYKCTTLHMDNLYNGWNAPFDRHLVDALKVACSSHQKSEKFSLSFFNWSKSEYEAATEIPQSQLLILEGVGASQAVIRPYLTASIWIDIDPALGLERVLHRDGDSISADMERWLTTQEQHFLENKSQMSADFELSHP
jgi:uridine kinase